MRGGCWSNTGGWCWSNNLLQHKVCRVAATQARRSPINAARGRVSFNATQQHAKCTPCSSNMLGAQVSVLLQQHNITLQQHTRRVGLLPPHATTQQRCAIATRTMVESGGTANLLPPTKQHNASSAMEPLQQGRWLRFRARWDWKRNFFFPKIP
jgi:hypothetical protein